MVCVSASYTLMLTLAAITPRGVAISADPATQLEPTERAAAAAALAVEGFREIDPVDAAAIDGVSAAPAGEAPEALYIEAKKALMNFDDAAARDKLVLSRALLCESPRILSERQLLADTHLLSGVMALAEGRMTQAEREFTMATQLEPGRTLHPGLYPPDVIKAYQSAKHRIASRARGALVVQALPREAALYVDGTFHGQTPIVVEQLAAGPHYVTAVVQDRGARTRVVNVDGGHSTRLEIFVPDTADTPVAELLDAYRATPDEPRAAARLLDRIGAEIIVALGPGVDTAARRAADDQVITARLDAVEEVDIGERTRRLVSLLRAEGAPAPLAGETTGSATSAPSPPPTSLEEASSGEEEDPSPVSPWVWVGAGAGGVAVISGVAVVVFVFATGLLEPPPPSERARIVW